jgi:hypothetical protein
MVKVIKDNTISNFPKEVTCPSCTSVLQIDSYKDVSGEQGSHYNETYVNLYLRCPCCQFRIDLSETDFTRYEIGLITQKSSTKLAEDYYDK